MTDRKLKSLAKKMAKAEVEAKAAREVMRKKEKQNKILNTVGYLAGSAALFAVACVTLPPILSNVSGALYKSSLKKTNRDNDDWEPVIVWKETAIKPEQPEQTELQEEAFNS